MAYKGSFSYKKRKRERAENRARLREEMKGAHEGPPETEQKKLEGPK